MTQPGLFIKCEVYKMLCLNYRVLQCQDNVPEVLLQLIENIGSDFSDDELVRK